MLFIRLILTLLVFAVFPVFAQEGESSVQTGNFACRAAIKPEKGVELLGKVQTAYNKLNSLKAKFTQNSYLAALDQSEGSAGEVTFSKPGLMRWDYHTPEEQTFLIREHAVWFYQPVLSQVVIDKFERVLISDLPVSFLLGLGDLKHDFKLKSGCNTDLGVLFELAPTGKDKGAKEAAGGNELKNFFLLADSASFLPKGAKVFDVSGNTTAIVFEGLQPDVPVEERRFEPKFPAGTDVSDRR